MNKELNLVEILKNCPQGTPLYSPICGECGLNYVFNNTIIVKLKNEMLDGQLERINFMTFDSKGRYGGDSRNDNIERECLLFPSKENRDWAKFNYKLNNKARCSNFNPFDKVLVRNATDDIWLPRLFAYYGNTYIVCTDGNDYQFCIPYNEETAHLLGMVKDYE